VNEFSDIYSNYTKKLCLSLNGSFKAPKIVLCACGWSKKQKTATNLTSKCFCLFQFRVRNGQKYKFVILSDTNLWFLSVFVALKRHERCTLVATALGSIPAFYNPVESKGRHLQQCATKCNLFYKSLNLFRIN